MLRAGVVAHVALPDDLPEVVVEPELGDRPGDDVLELPGGVGDVELRGGHEALVLPHVVGVGVVHGRGALDGGPGGVRVHLVLLAVRRHDEDLPGGAAALLLDADDGGGAGVDGVTGGRSGGHQGVVRRGGRGGGATGRAGDRARGLRGAGAGSGVVVVAVVARAAGHDEGPGEEHGGGEGDAAGAGHVGDVHGHHPRGQVLKQA
ncbi:hypothetical protein OVA28_15595 [Curtobacterium sp. SL109]|nr:hypothetical protein [Curtobacterium sp. SL109]MCY1695813.1 hypothetical protein [Curtobacterium sp. SL109]